MRPDFPLKFVAIPFYFYLSAWITVEQILLCLPPWLCARHCLDCQMGTFDSCGQNMSTEEVDTCSKPDSYSCKICLFPNFLNSLTCWQDAEDFLDDSKVFKKPNMGGALCSEWLFKATANELHCEWEINSLNCHWDTGAFLNRN
jgi:hypothetical protein